MARGRAVKPPESPAIPEVQPNEAWTRRRNAAEKHRPKRIRLLLVVESPPSDLGRSFYFEDSGSEDALFEQVCEVLFEEKPRPGAKDVYLDQLRKRGFFVVELKPDAPRQGEELGPYVPWLALALEPLAPGRIVLVGAAYRAAREKLGDSGFSVVDVHVPAPEPGRETPFRQELRKAVVRAGLEKLIRPLPPAAKAALDVR